MPICLDSFACAWETPSAVPFQEKEARNRGGRA